MVRARARARARARVRIRVRIRVRVRVRVRMGAWVRVRVRLGFRVSYNLHGRQRIWRGTAVPSCCVAHAAHDPSLGPWPLPAC
jgi:hypothetical protein